MRVGGLTKSGTLGRGPMRRLTTCWSVCALEMAKENGLANLWVSVLTSCIFSLHLSISIHEPCVWPNVKHYLKSMTVFGTIVNIWQQSRHRRWVCERPRPSLSSANTRGRDFFVGMIRPWATQLINPTLHIHTGHSTSQKYSVVGTTGHFHKAVTQLYRTVRTELST